MSHPRVEEVSDSDPASDPEEVDIDDDDFADSDILRVVAPKSAPAPQALPRPSANQAAAAAANPPTAPDRSVYANFQCLYPVYFDASRTRAQGRRVSSDLAVRNPLAREIANACSRLRLPTLLEPDKSHPKDWANPGRVKVGLRASLAAGVPKSKHGLYVLVAQHLKENPTTEDSPGLRLRIGGQIQPDEGKPYPRPAVPRGWKMGELLPYMSPAMTGGGVSENLFKDMMKEMQGGGDPMSALMGAAGGNAPEEGAVAKKKKDKKGKGKA